MKIYNQEKTEIIENPDLEKGYLKFDEIVTIIPSNPYTEIPKKIDLDFTKMNYKGCMSTSCKTF